MIGSVIPIYRNDVVFIILLKFGRLTLPLVQAGSNRSWHPSQPDVLFYFKFNLNRALSPAKTVSKQINAFKWFNSQWLLDAQANEQCYSVSLVL